MIRKTLSAVLAILLLVGITMPAGFFKSTYAAVLTEQVQADLLYYDGGNYIGTDDQAGKLYVGTEGGGIGPSRAALRFNLGTVPGTVTKYELRLTLASLETENGSENSFYIDAWGSSNNDMQDTDNTFPAYDSAGPSTRLAYAAIPPISQNWILNMDVTNIVNAQTSAADRDVTFVLTGNESLNDLAKITIYSQEEANAGFRPQLVVTYVENEAPTGSISINNGSAYTNSTSVTLNLTSTDPEADPIEMRLSNDNQTWLPWEPAAATKPWTLISGDGVKTVYYQLRDDSNAESEIYQDSIELDTIPPIVSGVVEGGLYRTPITITANEGTATINGSPFVLGSQYGTDGSHTLVVTDNAGNKTTIAFSIDQTPPVVTGVTDGSSYNGSRTITFNEGTAILNGNAFMSGSTVNEEGSYTLTATDAAGNETKVTFTIDKTSPIVTGVTDGKLYNADRIVTFNEGTATLNGNPFVSGSTVAQDGDYTLIVTDAAGNATTVIFSLDKTVPVVTGVTDQGNYNVDRTITFNEGTATLNGIPFTSGMIVSEEDEYTLIVSDAAGNETTIRFAIDKTDPVVTGVADGESYNTTKTIVFNEGTATLNGSPFLSGNSVSQEGDYTLIVTDAAGNAATVTFSLDKTFPVVTGVTDGSSYNADRTISFNEGTATLNGSAFVSGGLVSEEGDYTLIVKDAADNEITIAFTIDKTNPLVTGVADNGLYNTNRTILFDEGTATLNGNPFVSGSTVEQEGDYTLIVTDAAGNSATIVFSLDKTSPVVTGVTDETSYNSDRTITFNEGTATLNGSAFVSGGLVGEEGDYTLLVTDAAGNETTVRFTVDKTDPIVTGVNNGENYNADRRVTFNEGTATLNGDSFASGDEVTEEGEYTLIVTDAAGNSTTVTFSLDKTSPVVVGVTDESSYNDDRTITFNEGAATLNGSVFVSGGLVSEEGDYTLIVSDESGNEVTVRFAIDKTAPIVTGVTDGELYNTDRIIAFDEGTAKLNGDSFVSGDEVAEEGEYTLIVIDAAGNETKVNFSLDKTAPVVNGVTDKSSYNDNRTITFEEGTATLNDKPFASGDIVSEEGDYALMVTDTAGNATTLAFSIDRTNPVVTGVSEQGKYTSSVTITFNEGTAILNDKPFTSGSTVSSNGDYKLVVTDQAGNRTSVNFSIALPNQVPDTVNVPASNGNTDTGGAASAETNSIDIIVNGQVQEQIATARTETRNGQRVTVVSVDEQKLDEKLRNEPNGSTVLIRVANAVNISSEWNGRMIKTMEGKEATLQIETSQASYTIPAKELNVDRISRTLGNAIALGDVKLDIEILQASDNEVRALTSGLNGAVQVAPAVQFDITANYRDKEVKVERFNTFVERTIAISNDANSQRITTGVVLAENGQIAHVPTRIEVRDGQTVAIINSMTNSVYSVIYQNKTFSDVVNHWARTGIEDMASRTIVQGVNKEQFLPEQDITRAEFAAILVRSLGLHHADQSAAFLDVNQTDWFYEAAAIGSSYGLIQGFENGEFRPNQKITREEALVLLFRAANLAGVNTEITENESSLILAAFRDRDQFNKWSESAAALNAKLGILNGYNGLASPKQQITRAETAVMIQRMLEKSGLI